MHGRVIVGKLSAVHISTLIVIRVVGAIKYWQKQLPSRPIGPSLHSLLHGVELIYNICLTCVGGCTVSTVSVQCVQLVYSVLQLVYSVHS